MLRVQFFIIYNKSFIRLIQWKCWPLVRSGSGSQYTYNGVVGRKFQTLNANANAHFTTTAPSVSASFDTTGSMNKNNDNNTIGENESKNNFVGNGNGNGKNKEDTKGNSRPENYAAVSTSEDKPSNRITITNANTDMIKRNTELETFNFDLTPPSNCCRSGCITCVWLEYVEELSKFYSNPDLGREKIHKDIESIEDPSIKAWLIMELKGKGLW